MRLNILSLLIILGSPLLLATQEEKNTSKLAPSVQKEINSEIRKIAPKLRECFVVKENAKPETLKVIVIFDLPKTTGPATNVQVSPKSQVFDKQFRQCVQDAIASIVFPDSADQLEHRSIEYPLFFNAATGKK